MQKAILPALLGAALSAAFLGPADASNARTWISGHGVDQAECGPVANPCRSLSYAYSVTNEGGEIDVLDGAGYGSLTIDKSISIINDGAGAAGVLAASGGPGIAINAGPTSKVILRGLTIEGANVGSNGVEFRSGGSLTISNCTIQGFSLINYDYSQGNGIYVAHVTGSPTVSISNVVISENAFAGVFYRPKGTGGGKIAADRLTAMNNQHGFVMDTAGSTSSSTLATVTNSVASNNSLYGFAFNAANSSTGGLIAHLSASAAGGNTSGVYISGTGAFLVLSGVTAAANSSADLAGPSGNVYADGNNVIIGKSGGWTKQAVSPF